MTTTFKAQVRTVPDGLTCMVRRPGDTIDRQVFVTRETRAARVNEWMLVVEEGSVWWGVVLFGSAAEPPPAPMPDPDNPSPPPAPSGTQRMLLWPDWVGYRMWRPHTGPGSTPAGFARRADGSPYARVGNAQADSSTVPNPNPSYRAEAMGLYSGAEGLEATSMVHSFITWSHNPPVTGAQALLWKLPVSPPPDSAAAHPAGLVLLSVATFEFEIGPFRTVRWTVPEAWRADLMAGIANGIGVRYPPGTPPQPVWPTVTLSSLEVTYET